MAKYHIFKIENNTLQFMFEQSTLENAFEYVRTYQRIYEEELFIYDVETNNIAHLHPVNYNLRMIKKEENND